MGFIELATSIDDATEFIVRVLAEQFNNTLDEKFARTGDTCADGLVLPSLPALEVYRYPSPTNQDRQQIAGLQQQAVSAFVGFIGDSASEATYSATATQQLYEAQRPFGAAVLFNHISQADLATPGVAGGQTRAHKSNELMYRRSIRYLGALEHTIHKYVCRNDAATNTIPRSDLPLSGSVEIGQGKYGLWGVVYYEFDVEQDVLFPTHQNLP